MRRIPSAIVLVLACACWSASAPHPGTPATSRPLPPGAVAQLVEPRLYQGGEVQAMEFSPDSRRLLTGGAGGALGPTAWLHALRLWETEAGTEVHTLTDRVQPMLNCVAFVAAGRRVVAPLDSRSLGVWDVSTGQQVDTIEVSLPQFAAAPDGNTLALADGEALRLWDLAGKKALRSLGAGTRLRFSPDGSRLAGVVSQAFSLRLTVWDTADGKAVYQHQLPSALVSTLSLAFSADGTKLAMAVTKVDSTDSSLLMHDLETGQVAYDTKLDKAGWVRQLEFSPDGARLLVLTASLGIATFRAADGADAGALDIGLGFPVARLALSPDGKTLALAEPRGAIRLYDLASRSLRLAGPEQRAASLSPDGRRAWAADALGRAYAWDLAAPAAPKTFGEPATQPIAAAVFSEGGRRLAVVPADQPMRVYDTADGQVVAGVSLEGRGGWGGVSADLRRAALARATDTALAFRIAPLGHGGASAQGAAPVEKVRRAVFSPTLARLATLRDGTLDLESLEEGARQRLAHVDTTTWGAQRRQASAAGLGFNEVLRIPRELGPHCAFSQQEDLLAWSTNTYVTVTELASLRPVAMLELEWALGFGLPYGAVRFSPDGRYLAAGVGPSTVVVWDLASRQVAARFSGHRSMVHDLAFSADNSRLISSSADTVLVWDLTDALGGATRPAEPPDTAALAALWTALDADSPAQAYAALAGLVEAGPPAVALLKDRLRPADAPPEGLAQQVQQAIARLGDPAHAVRAKASRDLEALGTSALPYIRQALPGVRDEEARTRLTELLEAAGAAPGQRQALRAIVALERMASPSAEELLKSLAAGGTSAQTAAARAALSRLAGRHPARP